MDQMAMLWSTEPGVEAREVPSDRKMVPRFSPDGGRIAVTAKVGNELQAQIWELATRRMVHALPQRSYQDFSRDGTETICVNESEVVLEYWPANASAPKKVKLVGITPDQPAFWFYGFSPERDRFFSIADTGLIRIWDAHTGAQVGSLNGPKAPIRAAVLSPGSKYFVVTVERENVIHLIEVKSGIGRTLQGHRDFVSGLAFTSDCAMLASASMDGTLKLWDCDWGTEIATFSGHLEEATDVAFSPDNRTLASVGQGESVKFWHVLTRREMISIELPKAGHYIQFSPDGTHLAVTTSSNALQFFEAPRVK
jgi:WD40 repeat protein